MSQHNPPVEPPWVGALYEDGRTRFRVWAPKPRLIALRIVNDNRLLPLESVEGGYYEANVSSVEPGTRYLYRLDDTVERPDPASRFQPQGVHAPSQVTRRTFAWTDADWRGLAWNDYVIYETHVGTFTAAGTFTAMIDVLDQLVDLGVTALQLMPVAQFPGGRNWGYDGVHLFAPQNTYGGPEGLKRLVDACHARSLAVVMDVVYNHLGPEGNYLAEFGPYFSDRQRTGWGEAVNVDGQYSDPVRDFLVANAVYWIDEFHVDALRLDATHAIFDQSARPFLRELAAAVHACGQRLQRRVFVIAENHSNDPRIVESREVGGYGLNAQLLDDFHHSLHALLTGERSGHYADFSRPADFSKAYGAGFVLTGEHSKYRHRRWGADASHLPADRFVAYAQCHDTVANRPRSQRLGQLIGFEELKLAAAATILSPSIPFLFMGEEYDDPAPFYYFTSHLDPALADSVRAGRVRDFTAFGWPFIPPDPQSVETFERSRLSRALAGVGNHAVLLNFYRKLLELRRQLPAIRQASRQLAHTTLLEEQNVLIAGRRIADNEIRVCFHFGAKPATIESGLIGPGPWTVVLNSANAQWQGPCDATCEQWSPNGPLQLHPKSCILLSRTIAPAD